MNKICIIGLGYVGLPLAHAFASKHTVVGFDINEKRIDELKNGKDITLELTKEQLDEVLNKNLTLSSNIKDIQDANIYIITVPTPIDKYKNPDLTPLIKASQTVSKVLKKGDLVIYESTVYPGTTEEVCVPILENCGLKFNVDFDCGYSPERINPGDKEHTVTKIKKVTSGSNEKAALKVDELYKSIIIAGTHLAPSIKVAEAAKVIENSQRDINIAFVNELSHIFNILNIDTNEVLKAAGTKWNFLNFKPGLVGGHCIGVDPYYLTHKAIEVGYHPEIILAGRRLNDNMGIYIANQVIKLMIKKGHKIEGSSVLVLGLTFKENCPDIRNSRVIDIIRELKEFGCNVEVSDYWASAQDVKREYNLELLNLESNKKIPDFDKYSAVVLAVAHQAYKDIEILDSSKVVYDVKSILKKSDGSL